MFCHQCGQQIPDDSINCPVCGAALNAQDLAPDANARYFGGFSKYLRDKLSGSLFLTMCIIMSAIAVVSLFKNPNSVYFDIIAILLTCSFWITYIKAKASDGTMQITGLKFTSGVVTALWVLMWIAIGLIAIALVFMLVAGPFVSNLMSGVADGSVSINNYLNEIGQNTYGIYDTYQIQSIVGLLGSAFYTVCIVITVIALACCILYNILYMGNMKKFSKMLHESYMRNQPLTMKLNALAGWTLAFGILNAISSFASLSISFAAFISSALSAVVLILASVWMKSFNYSEDQQ